MRLFFHQVILFILIVGISWSSLATYSHFFPEDKTALHINLDLDGEGEEHETEEEQDDQIKEIDALSLVRWNINEITSLQYFNFQSIYLQEILTPPPEV